jgi:hypothetical protein
VHVVDSYVVWTVRTWSSDHQSLSFGAAFGISRHPLSDGVVHGQYKPLMWHWQPFVFLFFFFFSLSYLNLVLALPRFQTSLFNFFFLHSWSISFWLCFFLITYKIAIVFLFHNSFIFFNLSNLVFIHFIAIYFFGIIFYCSIFYNFILHRFFFLSNLIFILVIDIFFTLTNFLNWYFFSRFYPSKLNWLGFKLLDWT